MNYEMIKEAYELGVKDAMEKIANPLWGTGQKIFNAFGKGKYVWAPRLTEAGIGAGVGAIGGAGAGLAGSDPGHRVGDTLQGAVLGGLAGGVGAPLFGHFKMQGNIRNALSQGQDQLRMMKQYSKYRQSGQMGALTNKGLQHMEGQFGGMGMKGLNKQMGKIQRGMQNAPGMYQNQAWGGSLQPFNNVTNMKKKMFGGGELNTSKYMTPRVAPAATQQGYI
jgi:hypothetical protein